MATRWILGDSRASTVHIAEAKSSPRATCLRPRQEIGYVARRQG
jgi:hypothetical protein